MNWKITLGMMFLAAFAPSFSFAQSTDVAPKAPEKKQVEWGIDGMLAVSYGSETLGINVGGPSLKLRFKKFKIGVGAFPSLIVVDEKAMPRLAVSPIVEYKTSC